MPAGAHPLMETVTASIEKRARALLSGLADDTGAEDDALAQKAPAAKGRKVSKPKAARQM